MSGQATGWVLRNGPRDHAMRAVLIVIADAANREGERSRPGLETIAEGSLYSEGHCRRMLGQLQAQGWIEQTSPSAPGRSAEYRLPMMAEPDNAARPDARRSPRTQARAVEGQRRADAARTPRVQTRAVVEAAPLFPITGTGTGAPATNGANTNGHAPKEADPLYGFAHFWESYPKRDDKRLRRGEAEKVWRRLSIEDKRAAFRGARNYAQACDGGLTRARDAFRFLRDRDWDDWQTPAQPDTDRRNGHEPSTTWRNPAGQEIG